MTRRTAIIEQIGIYFLEKGKVLTADEYKEADDAPVRFQLIKRSVGSWSRLINMIGDTSRFANLPVGTIDPEVTAPGVDDVKEELKKEKPKAKS